MQLFKKAINFQDEGWKRIDTYDVVVLIKKEEEVGILAMKHINECINEDEWECKTMKEKRR